MSILLVILIVAADIVISAIVLVFVLMNKKRNAAPRIPSREYEERRTYAQHCTAVVADARGGIPGGEAQQARMAVTLDVAPQDAKPYRAHAVWLVDLAALGNLRQGSEIQVKVDAEDRRIVYPGGDWARYLPE